MLLHAPPPSFLHHPADTEFHTLSLHDALPICDAKVFLMDEPLSNLDAKLRVQMRAEIQKLHQRLQTTTIYVTHDQTEAMTIDRKSTRLNSSHVAISYAVFCLKKKKKTRLCLSE